MKREIDKQKKEGEKQTSSIKDITKDRKIKGI
jgi:hypothetical protein